MSLSDTEHLHGAREQPLSQQCGLSLPDPLAFGLSRRPTGGQSVYRGRPLSGAAIVAADFPLEVESRPFCEART